MADVDAFLVGEAVAPRCATSVLWTATPCPSSQYSDCIQMAAVIDDCTPCSNPSFQSVRVLRWRRAAERGQLNPGGDRLAATLFACPVQLEQRLRSAIPLDAHWDVTQWRMLWTDGAALWL